MLIFSKVKKQKNILLNKKHRLLVRLKTFKTKLISNFFTHNGFSIPLKILSVKYSLPRGLTHNVATSNGEMNEM